MSSSVDIPQRQFKQMPEYLPQPVAEPAVQRRHDLDALRAIAMLLGIVLHAALSFTPIPWPVHDSHQGTFFEVAFAAIHGFRMPLFFLLSGFFTAMLWRKRGLSGLLRQRVMRIALPLFIGCFTIIPVMWGVNFFVSQPATQPGEVNYFDAAAQGDVETLKAAIQSGAVSVGELQPASGASMLTIATFCDQPETVEMLIQNGADVNQRNRDSGTALHTAVFMGRVSAAKLLLEAGADVELIDGSGNTPKDNLKVDFGTTNFVAQMYGQSLDEEALKSARAEIAMLLGEGDVDPAELVASQADASALYGLFFQLPVFMHLWFLAFLCWLIVGFIVYAALMSNVNFKRIPKSLFCSPLSLLWLVPLTMIPNGWMMPATFGPDPSVGLLPIPSVLGYYAIFFFFGAIYWDLNDTEGVLGRWWKISLPLALLVVFPLGLEFTSGTLGLISPEYIEGQSSIWGSLLQVLFAWLMIFGTIGMFRAWFAGENKVMRYVSDSSYWLYLAHLPLVILAQWCVKDLPIPAPFKFLLIVSVVSAFLLVTYEYLIRYTMIGTMLNGRKKRVAKQSN